MDEPDHHVGNTATPVKIFLSYNFDDESFAQKVSYFLSTQEGIVPYCYAEAKRAGAWSTQVRDALNGSDAFVLFIGKKLGQVQAELEAQLAQSLMLNTLIAAKLPGAASIPDQLITFQNLDPITLAGTEPQEAEECAQGIAKLLGLPWLPPDGLPSSAVFRSEREVVEAYLSHQGRLGGKFLQEGYPESWPRLRLIGEKYKNPVSPQALGDYRPMTDAILADSTSFAASVQYTPQSLGLELLRAGPFSELAFPNTDFLTAAVIVSGGITPGINAAVAGIVQRHAAYSGFLGRSHDRLVAYEGGFNGLVAGSSPRPILPEEAGAHSGEGGSIITTSRIALSAPAAQEVVHKLLADSVDILYVIGGQGSIRLAHALSRTSHRMRKEGQISREFSVAVVPKTMDNDILWLRESFGFQTAVDKAKEITVSLAAETRANPCLAIVQLFGDDSGVLVSNVALVTKAFDAVLTPDVPFSLRALIQHMKERLHGRYLSNRGHSYGLIIKAEGAIPIDAMEYLDRPEIDLTMEERSAICDALDTNPSSRTRDRNVDAIRAGSLKLISRVMQVELHGQSSLRDFRPPRLFLSEPRHLIHGVAPSSSDVVFAERLGRLVVDGAMAGYTDFMISEWSGEYVLVPLDLVVIGRKRIPPNGTFWRSVLASTGQPSES